MTIRYEKPKEMICLLLFQEPRNVEYICQMLYGKKRNSRVSLWVHELIETGWIKEIVEIKSDRRNRFLQANPNCLMDSIEQDVKLNMNEKKKLHHYLSSNFFKEWIAGFITEIQPWQNQRWFSMIKDRICATTTLYYYLKKHSLFDIFKQFHDDFTPDLEVLADESLSLKLRQLNPFLSQFLLGGFVALEETIKRKNLHG